MCVLHFPEFSIEYEDCLVHVMDNCEPVSIAYSEKSDCMNQNMNNGKSKHDISWLNTYIQDEIKQKVPWKIKNHAR